MRRKRGSGSVIILTLFTLLIAAVVFVYNAQMFERNAPEVDLKNNGFWNLRSPLKLKIEDESGIKYYSVILQTSTGQKELSSGHFIAPTKDVSLEIKPPRDAYAIKDKKVKIIIEAHDASKWNFFNGNAAHKEYLLNVDKRRPLVSVVINSYKITRGGSALVIFKAKDANLDQLYIQTNFGKRFKVTPFHKEGYYIALLAWPIKERNFRASVVATDLAGNSVKAYVPLYLKDRNYRVSHINVTDRFLNGKVADLASQFDLTQGVDDPIERFKLVNEDIRKENEKLIHDITSKVPTEMVDDFKIHRMYPLKNAKVVAGFGDHRLYYYNGRKISESYHMGLDLASEAMAPIKPQNGGEVVFADFNGLYGNMPIIHHGLGLYTLYGHCSSLAVSKGDEVTPREVIAHTGKSGYAMGDHLHFGVLVQGIEVRPQEWMDKRWIKLNITKIIDMAKKMIDKG